MNLRYRATLQKMDVSTLLPDRSSMFQFDVHCRPIINKTVLLLDDWRDPFPSVFIHFLHYSLYSSHRHISEKLNKKILLAASKVHSYSKFKGSEGHEYRLMDARPKRPNFCSFKFFFSAVRSVRHKLLLTLGCFWNVSQKVHFAIT